MANIVKKLQEKRIDRLHQKKKEAVMSGNMAKKEKLDAKIAKARGRSLSPEDMLKKGGSVKSKSLSKAQTGKVVKSKPKPTYDNLRGSGWDYFKTPTAKDSLDYRKGFEQGLKKVPLKQYPSPTGPTIRGYNEGFKKTKTKKKG